MPVRKHSPLGLAGKIASRFLFTLFAFLLLVAAALLAGIWVLVRGPSPAAQRMFVLTVKETDNLGFLADIYLSDDEIDNIMTFPSPKSGFIKTDTSRITIPADKPAGTDGGADNGGKNGKNTALSPEALPDEADNTADLELTEVTGAGYRGFMLIVKDPSRLFIGTPANIGESGITLMDLVERTGAVAGVNAGWFYDSKGTATSGRPDGIVICDGLLKWGAVSGITNVIGFDANGVLHTGMMTPLEAVDLGLQWAVSCGPTLISNGIPLGYMIGSGGLNARTAIGQRADGTVLLLVIDGRQIHSQGATYNDLIDILLDFGAVNAANLTGGPSSLMVINGEIVNSCASVFGPLPLPTAFLIR